MNKYNNPDYWINKVKNLKGSFCVGSQDNGGGQHCINGHSNKEEQRALVVLFSFIQVSTKDGHTVYDYYNPEPYYSNKAATVNNGRSKEYPQATIEERLLAAFNDIKVKMQQEVNLKEFNEIIQNELVEA